jgi:uncharacterized protein YgbK (DUF1537 family)
VLDDDPTGSQAVHDVAVVTVLERAEYAAALAQAGATAFVLTNTRSLPEGQAVDLTARAGRELMELGVELGAPLDVVSRSDSTLRGHVRAEVGALERARREVLGSGYDGVLLVPAYLEAGRVTAGDVHLARVQGELVPVGESEFARDAAFGYASSNLRDFVAERSGGAVRAEDVASIGLDDIRLGGPDRVAEVLARVEGGQWVVVNATDYADLEVVVLGLLAAEEAGRAFVHRTGPSFVRALAGIEPLAPLGSAEVWGSRAAPEGHGLVVVGSHVGLTSRQVAALRTRGDVVEVELDVATVAAGTGTGAGAGRGAGAVRRDEHVAAATRAVCEGLAGSDVLLLTSRELHRGADPDSSLAIARATSAAVVEVVRGALAARPGWVVAKGGITSHDVAVRGLGIRRATVLGQLLPGQVSVLEPVEADPAVVGVPYVVFAGNVGDETSLVHVVDVLRGTPEAVSG